MNPNPAPPTTPAPTRRRGLKIGRIVGVPIYLNASWILLRLLVVLWFAPEDPTGPAALRSYALGAAFAGCLLLSVLLHEVGHAVTARHYRIGVRAITLELLGGYT